MIKHRIILTYLIVFFLTACGSTVLVKYEGTSSVNIGKNAISEVNKFHSYIFHTQNQLAASLIARYPSCNFGDSIVVRTNSENINQQIKIESLCLSDAELREWQLNPKLGKKIDLMPLERSSLKLSMDILDAFSMYLEAISKYTASPNASIGNTLKGVTDELVAVQEKAKFLPDAVSSKISQINAVSDFIGYIEKLIKNSNDAKAITKIVELEGEIQERNLLAVAKQADDIFQTYIASMSATLTTTLGDYYNKNKNTKEFDSLEKKQIFLSELFKQRQLDKQIHTSSSPGAQAIRLFVSAHQKLRDSITGNYSKEQKAFVLEENMKELKEGLQHVANLAKFAMAFL